MLDSGFIDTFRHFYPKQRQFSFWNHKGCDMRGHDRGWRIDYALVSKEHIGKVVDCSIHKEFTGSDHCPVQLKLDFER